MNPRYSRYTFPPNGRSGMLNVRKVSVLSVIVALLAAPAL